MLVLLRLLWELVPSGAVMAATEELLAGAAHQVVAEVAPTAPPPLLLVGRPQTEMLAAVARDRALRQRAVAVALVGLAATTSPRGIPLRVV